MRYAASRIREVREEISELKEDEIDGDNTQTEIFVLKNELKDTRTKRKRMHKQWEEVTDEEEKRRTMLDLEENNKEMDFSSISNTTLTTNSTMLTSPTKTPISISVNTREEAASDSVAGGETNLSDELSNVGE